MSPQSLGVLVAGMTILSGCAGTGPSSDTQPFPDAPSRPGIEHFKIDGEPCAAITAFYTAPEAQLRPYVPSEFILEPFAVAPGDVDQPFPDTGVLLASVATCQRAMPEADIKTFHFFEASVVVTPANQSWGSVPLSRYMVRQFVDDSAAREWARWLPDATSARFEHTILAGDASVLQVHAWTIQTADMTLQIRHPDPNLQDLLPTDHSWDEWSGKGPFARQTLHGSYLIEPAVQPAVLQCTGTDATCSLLGAAFVTNKDTYVLREARWDFSTARFGAAG